jgi:hypothetical protein
MDLFNSKKRLAIITVSTAGIYIWIGAFDHLDNPNQIENL